MATYAVPASLNHDMSISISSGTPAAPIEIIVSKPIQTKTMVANPAPLGLLGFACTAFFLSSHDAGFLLTQKAPYSVVVGLAAAYGGLAQLLAGMLEFQAGNTFGATVFCSYAAFWLSFVVNEIPGFGVRQAFRDSNSASDFNEAMALYFFCWTVFTLMMLLCSLRTNVCTVVLFSMATVTFLLLTLAALTQNKHLVMADGISGMITAIISAYLALAQLMNKKDSFFELPIGQFSPPKEV
ncbi:hypothetical protein Mapa_014675 [Marchantia paleacea]|nr:hypothetical protein Mapa_014675 [Marchantia paleacea]